MTYCLNNHFHKSSLALKSQRRIFSNLSEAFLFFQFSLSVFQFSLSLVLRRQAISAAKKSLIPTSRQTSSNPFPIFMSLVSGLFETSYLQLGYAKAKFVVSLGFKHKNSCRYFCDFVFFVYLCSEDKSL